MIPWEAVELPWDPGPLPRPHDAVGETSHVPLLF